MYNLSREGNIDLQNLRISSKTSAIDDERSRGYLNTESKTPRASCKLGERTNGKKVILFGRIRLRH